MSVDPGYKEIEGELRRWAEKGLRRELPPLERREGPYVYLAGRRLLNLSSNDYLGLSTRMALEDLLPLLSEEAFGAGAARLLSGNHALYEQVETRLEELYGRPALVFNSGYLANLGIISALCGRHDAIFADKLVHASIIDGARLSGARLFRFPHQDYEALERLLAKKRPSFRRALIVTESVFSMDGDKVDLKMLLTLKERYGAFLFLDEAHAVGVLGERGLGLAEEEGLGEKVDLLLGTCGKALGSYGAFVVVSKRVLKDYLVNKARSFVFTTALPPVVLAATSLALKLVPGMRGERRHLRELSSFLRQELSLPPGDTPIVPVIVGEAEKALSLSRRLRERGFYVPAIRPPTVPENTARIRISLTALHTRQDLAPLIKEIKGFLSENS
ncbi:MAG: 8-amino-7-oxononanoate synthase [Thermodesulfobacteria bacterium]|nr:8-amino-7-oxononanoate synthase [Thermodesulfobacteriota bacterium]